MKKEKDQDISETLLEIIKTKDDARELLLQIEDALNELYKHKKDGLSVIEDVFPYEKKEKMLALLAAQKVDVKNSIQVTEFFNQLQKTIQAIPVVSLTLAFEPKFSFIKKMSSWLVVRLKKTVLLDITVDRLLIGGAIVSSGGRYKDYSLKKILGEKLGYSL